jgi:hypothetical protein
MEVYLLCDVGGVSASEYVLAACKSPERAVQEAVHFTKKYQQKEISEPGEHCEVTEKTGRTSITRRGHPDDGWWATPVVVLQSNSKFIRVQYGEDLESSRPWCMEFDIVEYQVLD